VKQLTLILSDSEFLRALELDRLRARFAKDGFDVEEVAAADAQAVAYAIDTPSLFGGGRLVVVRGDSKDIDALAERFVAWAERPPEGIAVAVVAGGAAKLRKAVGTRAEIVDVAAPKPWETADWLVRFVKARTRVMTKDAAVALTEALGTDLRDLASAIEQLMSATSGQIGVDTVARQFRGFESKIYTFLEAVVQRDRSASLKHLGALLRSGDSHPLQVHAALANQFRAVAAARDVARTPAAQLAKELELSVGYVNRAFKHGRNFDTGEIRRAFRLLAEADLNLKGGFERSEDQPAELVLELLVAEICGDRPAPVQRARRPEPARRR
jgi:DNA polymerase-3 subunit delta